VHVATGFAHTRIGRRTSGKSISDRGVAGDSNKIGAVRREITAQCAAGSQMVRRSHRETASFVENRLVC
jgi:hypothetical protein